MSRILGIIAEYNPFHNGHLYHLEEAKRIAKPEYTVCVMGGNFSQRGNTSIVDKWTKANMALLNGIDLVVELPTLYNISSAENFADGAIKVLEQLNVDTIAFGAECSSLSTLQTFADVLATEPKEYISLLNHELGMGLSFPKARENALLMYLNDIRKYANVLSSPNNILGIEYLKTLKMHKSKILPLIIQRKDSSYNDQNFIGTIASATAVRKLINSGKLDKLKTVLPRTSYDLLIEQIKKGNYVANISKFDKEILYLLRKMSLEEIANIPDVTEGLENSIKSAANSCNTISDFINIIKSKRYTTTRFNRILLYTLLNITKRDMELSKKIINPYIRILGLNSKGKVLLSELTSTNSRLNIITSVKKFVDTCNNKQLRAMFEKDIFATNVYTLGYEYDSWANLDYTTKLITL